MGIFNRYNTRKKGTAEETIDFEKDMKSIIEFLAGVGKDIKELYDLCIKVRKIRQKERSEVDDKKQKKLLTDEINAWDKLLERFVMFDRDTDVTGERIKNISKVLQEEALKINLDKETIKKTRTKDEWVFDW
ncbi:MAG: hypothetical protein KAU20_03445 [Nanoarchaeota archaeon]|nr:hypothetical protein [Nanoarchaeota archaeon]